MEAPEKCIPQNPSDKIEGTRDQFEHHPEESKSEAEEDPEEDLVEEVKMRKAGETVLDLELHKKLREVPGNEVPVCSLESFYNCNDDQAEETSEASLSKQTSECDSDECEHKSGSVKSNEKKRRLDVASGLSTPLLCYQSRKKCKQEGSSKPKLDLEPSGLELNNDFVIAAEAIDKRASNKEGSGSSGKRRGSRYEPQPEEDGDDQTCKRRKTRWSGDDTRVKILGPLQLPDFTKDFVIGADKDPEIQGLKAELCEINRKLQRPCHDDRPEEERSPSPEPIYDNLGIRINTRVVRLHQKLLQKRQNIISKLIKSNPTFNAPPEYKPPQLFKKLYIPVKEYPEYKFVGLIIGPRGNTQKRMEDETGAKILLRGKGSSKTPKKPASNEEDLHVRIEADNQRSLDAAVAMVEKLLVPIEEGRNEHKRAQLKELAILTGTVRDENVCSVCGDKKHQDYACPNLQSTFKMNSCDTCCSNSHSKPACPLTAFSPQSDSMQCPGFGISSIQQTQRKPGKEINDSNLYVGYLPQSVHDKRLRELFSPFGKISEAKVIKDRTTGISKGYGFVKFENSMDAAAAVTRLNGFKIDGKLLKVRIAGLPLNTKSPSLSHLPQHPGPAAISQTVTGPLYFMLPERQTSFFDSSGMKIFSCTINSEHSDLKKALGFTPPATPQTPDFSNSSNMHYSCYFSDQSLFSSGTSTPQFTGDPGHPGSQYQSYFVTPTFRTATMANLDNT